MSPNSEVFNLVPKLSIAVPNRNQIGGLKIQENCLRNWASDYAVEVLVSDNQSDDGSAEYLTSNWSDFARVSLFSDDAGIVGNLRNLAERARGEWIWFIGSGDLPDQVDLVPLLNLLSHAPGNVSTYLDEGVYECLSPFLGGVIYRKATLLQVIGIEPDAIWPHVSWSLAIEESAAQSKICKTSLIHIEPWTSREDWHFVKNTFPFALSLNALLREAFLKFPKNQRLASDLRESEKTLLTWYVQDRMAGKVQGLNRSLFQAVRFSGSIFQFTFLKLIAISISLVPINVLNFLKRAKTFSSSVGK